MIQKILFSSAILASSLAVNAKTPVDLGVIESGVEYSYEALTPVQAQFSAPKADIMRVYCSGDIVYAYSDPQHQNMLPMEKLYYGNNGKKVSVYNVASAGDIYFFNDLPLDGGTFKMVYGKEDVEIYSVTPDPERGNASVSSNMSLDVVFNMPVKVTKCKLEIPGKSVEISCNIYDTTVTVNWYSILMQWYREGALQEGTPLTVTFTGVRDDYNSNNRPNFGDGAGKLVLNFTMAGKPAELVSKSNTPETMPYFLSYYLPGSEDGIVSLTFDKELDAQNPPLSVIQYGDVENMDYEMYVEYPEVIIDGCTASVNLQGVSRLSKDMVPGLPVQQYISLRITGIKSADGQIVWTGNPASPYSFGLSYNFREITYNIAADWYPIVGRTIQTGDNMEVWVLNGKRISFDSIDFSYTSSGLQAIASVPASQVIEEEDPDEPTAKIFLFAVPEINPDADTDIFVTFGGLLCGDGQDHSSDVTARYRAATSGVESVETSDADGAIYDLQGRRMLSSDLAPGMYVRNGKKILISL